MMVEIVVGPVSIHSIAHIVSVLREMVMVQLEMEQF